MTRTDLQIISRARQREAKLLLANKHHAGAYYLIGYAVECALKAVIARKTARYDFPDKEFAMKVFSHNLGELLKHAGLKPDLDLALKASAKLALNWKIVQDWSVESRYFSNVSSAKAIDLYTASVSRNGILPWIRRIW